MKKRFLLITSLLLAIWSLSTLQAAAPATDFQKISKNLKITRIEHHDSIGIHNCVQTMGDGEDSAVVELFSDCYLNQGVSSREEKIRNSHCKFHI